MTFDAGARQGADRLQQLGRDCRRSGEGHRGLAYHSSHRRAGGSAVEIQSAVSFAAYFDGIRGRTLRVAACIPRDRLDWAPRAGAFSFGDLLRHLGAIERYMFAENAQAHPSRSPAPGPELADD